VRNRSTPQIPRKSSLKNSPHSCDRAEMKRPSLKHIFALPFVSVCLGLVAMACEPAETNTPAVEAKYTLESVCGKLPAPTCMMRQSCCTQASGYDEAACMTDVMTACEKNVADVKAGIMTFDGEFIDACIAATQAYSDKCFLTFNDLFAIPEDLEPCTHAFTGQLADGAACDRTEQCKSSVADRQFVRCDTMTKKCTTYTFLPLDAACSISTKATEICDEGLYCKAFLLDGKCQPITPLGAACTPKQLSLECGFGNTCDSATSICIEAKAEGEACATPLDCKSVTCTGSVCVKPDPLFNAMQCKGMP
jgi:hypothetical protein